MKPRILLTGGRGFIGQHIQSGLFDRYEIVAPLRSELELSDGVSVDRYMEANTFDYIIHAACAGVSRGSHEKADPNFYLKQNLQSFINLFRWRGRVKRLIHLSSGAIYGRPFSSRLCKESKLGERFPSDAYGLAKAIMSQMTVAESPDRIVHLVLFGVFGVGEDYSTRLISNAIVSSLKGFPIVLNQNSEFDYVFVNDLVRLLPFFIEGVPQFSHYNITPGQPVTLLDVVKIVHEITQNPFSIEAKNVDIKESYTGDNMRLRSFLPGTFTFTPMRLAIESMVTWYRDYL